MAGTVEQLPLRIGQMVVHRLGDVRRAEVIGAADDECRTRDLLQAVGIVEVLQRPCGVVFVGSPSRGNVCPPGCASKERLTLFHIKNP